MEYLPCDGGGAWMQAGGSDNFKWYDCKHCSDGTFFYVLIAPDGKQYKGTVTVVGEK